VVVSLLLQNVWRYLHYEYVATPRRGGRRLWWWPYKEFVNMIRRAAWTALAVRRAVPANRHLTTDSTANHRPSKPAGGGDAVASAADRRRQRQLSVDPSVILSSRPSVQPLRHRTQAAETASRGCFVRY